jgi:hypothetical protein
VVKKTDPAGFISLWNKSTVNNDRCNASINTSANEEKTTACFPHEFYKAKSVKSG